MRKITALIPLSVAAVLVCLASNKNRQSLTVRAVTHASRVNERTSTYTTPGTSNTNCSETGTTNGGTTTVATNCQTISIPPQTNPITTRTIDVKDLVEANGVTYTIVCTAHWVGSNCAPMVDGDLFQAEIDGNTMWIAARKGGNQGKQARIKYKILDIRPDNLQKSDYASTARALPPALDAYQKGDYVGAAKQWRLMADAGDPIAQFNLGLLYLDGHGVPQSSAEAVNWFRRAAEQDYTLAQHNLGAMYGSGQGMELDYVQAYKWLNICAAKGNSGCVAQRDLIAKKLKPAQVAEGQRLSTDFKPQKEAEKQ